MGEDLWVFGYGSLMWRPGFTFQESHRARLHGYHRHLCVYSPTYRGTPDRPGLVMGLDRGGACVGVAFRVTPADRERVISYLDERELDTDTYRRVTVKLRLSEADVLAETYVVRRADQGYAGRLSDAQIVALIRQGHGSSGPCIDYVANTVGMLQEMGIADKRLERLLAKVRSPLPPRVRTT